MEPRPSAGIEPAVVGLPRTAACPARIHARPSASGDLSFGVAYGLVSQVQLTDRVCAGKAAQDARRSTSNVLALPKAEQQKPHSEAAAGTLTLTGQQAGNHIMFSDRHTAGAGRRRALDFR